MDKQKQKKNKQKTHRFKHSHNTTVCTGDGYFLPWKICFSSLFYSCQIPKNRRMTILLSVSNTSQHIRGRLIKEWIKVVIMSIIFLYIENIKESEGHEKYNISVVSSRLCSFVTLRSREKKKTKKIFKFQLHNLPPNPYRNTCTIS